MTTPVDPPRVVLEAAAWLRRVCGVRAVPATDDVVDVVGPRVAVRVLHTAVGPVGQPVVEHVQRIAAGRGADAICIAPHGFTRTAHRWASEQGMALFSYELSVHEFHAHANNAPARHLLREVATRAGGSGKEGEPIVLVSCAAVRCVLEGDEPVRRGRVASPDALVASVAEEQVVGTFRPVTGAYGDLQLTTTEIRHTGIEGLVSIRRTDLAVVRWLDGAIVAAEHAFVLPRHAQRELLRALSPSWATEPLDGLDRPPDDLLAAVAD